MRRAQGVLVLATMAWGLSLTTAAMALADLTAFDLLLLEVGSGTLAVVLVCLATGRRIRGPWRPAFLLGSLEPGIAYALTNLGLLMTSAAVGSMIFSLESVFVVLLAAVVLRVRPVRVEVLALGLGLIGTLLVASAEHGGSSSTGGVLLILVATVAAAGYTFATQRLARGVEPLGLVARQGLAGLVVTAPFVAGSWVVEGTSLTTAPASALALGVLSGLLGFALPFSLWTFAVPRVRPGFAAVTLNLTPLFGVVGAVLLGQGSLSAPQWFGGALILLGVGALVRSELRRPAPVPLPTRAPREPAELARAS